MKRETINRRDVMKAKKFYESGASVKAISDSLLVVESVIESHLGIKKRKTRKDKGIKRKAE